MTRVQLVCLIAILAIGGILRLWHLGAVPPGLFRDEAEKGVNAYSLLERGTDMDGRRFPLFVRAVGARTSAFYQYLSIPWIAAFGLNEFATRANAALMGVLTLGFVFLLGRRLFSTEGGLWSALVLCIMPWHLQFSRWAQEGIMLPCFLTLGLGLLIGGLKKPRWYLVLPGALALGLATYTYAVAHLLVPLVIVAVGVIYNQDWRRAGLRVTLAAVIVYIAVLIPLVLHFLEPGLEEPSRFERVSVFAMAESWAHVPWLVLRNYLHHFNPVFLFITGDNNLRHSPPGVGQLTGLMGVLAVWGLVRVLRRRRKGDKLTLALLLLAPLAAALTNEGIPHALRSITAVLPWALLGGIGAAALTSWLREHVRPVQYGVRAAGVLVLILLVEGAIWMRGYVAFYPHLSQRAWQVGWRQVVMVAEARRKLGFDRYCWITPELGTPYLFLMFYTRALPGDPRFGAFYRDLEHFSDVLGEDIVLGPPGLEGTEVGGDLRLGSRQRNAESRVYYPVTPDGHPVSRSPMSTQRQLP